MISEIPFEEIIRTVLGWEGFTIEQSRIKNRKRERVVARHIAFYFARSMTRASLASIGAFLGKDHATVLHGIKTVNNLIDSDKYFRSKMWQYDIRLRKHRVKPSGMPFKVVIWRLTRFAYRNVPTAGDIAVFASVCNNDSHIARLITRLIRYEKHYKQLINNKS